MVGDSIILQLRHVGPASDKDLHGSGFTVAGLGHIRPVFLDTTTCADNADCVYNAECPEVDSAVDTARMAVAAMQWVSGAFIYFCTGGLVADTDDSTEIPYFLTANHCISKNRDARNLENFFQFTTLCNSGSCPTWRQLRDNYVQDLRTLGASVVSTGRKADYTLLQLTQSAPLGSAYLGWDPNPIAFSNGVHLYRISHPGGSPQSYSAHDVDTTAPTCTGWPRGDRIYSRDVFGATEGGSSGSPVVNNDGQIVGHTFGRLRH